MLHLQSRSPYVREKADASFSPGRSACALCPLTKARLKCCVSPFRQNAVLSGRTPADLCPFLRFWNRVSYPAWTNLEKAIRTDQAQATVTWPEETQRIVSEGLAAI
jgi:hypothetical protein